jgi:FKBP-type peptidyl-prolyl cis-trans isomerase
MALKESFMRSFYYLLLLGLVLVTIALVVRSGIAARNDPGVPINSAMRRAAEARDKEVEAKEDPVEAKLGAMDKTSSGLRYRVIRPGTGATPPRGALVSVHFEGRVFEQKPFDSSYQRGQPMQFRVGEGEVIKGWDEALLTMRKGEKRLLVVPYWLGYGENATRSIPPRATLVFELELVDFKAD